MTIKITTFKLLLGVIIGNKVKFEKHIGNTCQKAKRKLTALAKLVNYVDLSKKVHSYECLCWCSV